MEMQWDLLIPNLKEPERLALLKENIGLIFSGSSSHCAGTLKLGLKKAFELKKKKREPPGPPGVKLRCSNPSCSTINNNIMQTTHCCFGDYYYFQCVGCGCHRTGDYPSCQNCGKNFIV